MSNYSKLIDRFDRSFLYFFTKIISSLPKPKRKFYIDITYGIIKSKSVILSNIAHSLNEQILLKKTIERLSKFLNDKISKDTMILHYNYILSLMPSNLKVFIVDDTDVIKPYGRCFESMGKVKDASAIKTTFENGYRITSIVGLSKEAKHPLPFYDVFHSEVQKDFKSVNEYTLCGLTLIINHIQDYGGVFIFDRGYDDNKLFNFFEKKNQFFVVRLTKRRKIIIKTNKIKLVDAAKKKKGKIIIPITYKGNKLQAKASHIKVKLIGFKKTFHVVLNYLEDAKEPLMLLTNKPISSKEDVIAIVMNYCSRWKIEEYFRFKKVEFDFEDFRVRNLSRINHLTFCLNLSITYLTSLIENKPQLYYELISLSKNLKDEKSYLKFYQLISGINSLLGHKEKGIKTKQKIEHRFQAKQLTIFNIKDIKKN